MTNLDTIRERITAWNKAASAHSLDVENSDVDMTEAQVLHGIELADEAESLADRAEICGHEGKELARAFRVVVKWWLDTNQPIPSIQAVLQQAAAIA